MSLLQLLGQKLAEPHALFLTSAVASSSYFFFGNLGAAQFGIMPAIRDPIIAPDLSVHNRVKLWKCFYDVAKVCCVFSFISFFVTSLL